MASQTSTEKGNKKIIRAWVMYDWANSVYPLIISSAIFPILYEVNTSIKDTDSGKRPMILSHFWEWNLKTQNFMPT